MEYIPNLDKFLDNIKTKSLGAVRIGCTEELGSIISDVRYQLLSNLHISAPLISFYMLQQNIITVEIADTDSSIADVEEENFVEILNDPREGK